MKTLSLIRNCALVAAAVLVGAGPSAAATQPKVLVTATMSTQVAPLTVFVEEGAREFMARTAGARLQLLEDRTFTISGGSLPAIVGRWDAVQSNGQVVVIVWAKTDQVDLNGNLMELPDGTLGFIYFVQVNAPRTDGGSSPDPRAPRAGLKPASMQLGQVLVPGDQGSSPGTNPGVRR
jgi:hypothetical protein